MVGPTADGYYLMFFIGLPVAAERPAAVRPADCSRAPPTAGCSAGFLDGESHGFLPAEGSISMGWSRSADGPWSEPRVVLKNWDKPRQNQSAWDCYVTNPSAVLLPKGKVMLVFSSVPCAGGFSEALGVAFAPTWNGTYTQDATPIWRKPG
eukprot:SAG22_NODE_10650_length_523_cov_0.863208_1_plen_150_part_10